MKRNLLFVVLLSLVLSSCDKDKKDINLKSPSIIPAPASMQVNDGYFTLSNSSLLIFDEELSQSTEFFQAYLKNLNVNLHINHTEYTSRVYIQYDDTLENDEAYKIEIKFQDLVVSAKTEKGAFYAIQSLIQLLPVTNKNEEIYIPALTIEDEPRFSYRGMHLDVSRHLFPLEFIKKYIDAMAMLKMNNFHWHLTDDQGWRIEIKKYPKLQETAAYRDSTLLGHYNDTPQQYDGATYGGFYTQEEVREVIAFAKARHINIIPEIELPGHAQAAIAAYPELGCIGNQVNVATKWGVFENIYCPSEETFTFLENVLDEVIELFPSRYIHIGGDEAPKTQWKNSATAQQFIVANGLKDEHELQSFFIQHFEKHLATKGKKIIGWDEILEGGLAKDATVMSWRGMKGAIDAAQQGNDVIMTPTSHCYFDYYQSDNEDEPLAIGGYLPLEKVYNFNPIPLELTEEERKHVLGVQGNVWTEYMPTSDQVEYMAFPRMLAMSEVAWTPSDKRDYTRFVNNVEVMFKRLDAMDINYANHIYEVSSRFDEQGNYELSTVTLGKQIKYTLDGSTPDENATLYTTPIVFDKNLNIKAKVYDDGEALGRVYEQQLIHHKGVGAKITINKAPSKAYSGSGAAGLINGIKGSDSRYGDSEWLGFWGDDLEIEIEFEREVEINEIQLRFFHAPGQWIHAPTKYNIFLETENGRISDLVSIPISNENIIISDYKSERFMGYEDLLFSNLKLVIPNYGIIPEGKQGAGNKAWTFIDEIIIR